MSEARQTLIDILGLKANAAQQYSLAVKHMIRGVLEVCTSCNACGTGAKVLIVVF